LIALFGVSELNALSGTSELNVLFGASKLNMLFEITDELVKEVSNGIYEGTPDSIGMCQAKTSVVGQIHYKAIFFPLEPLPRPSPDLLANLEEKPFDCSTFYVLITLQAPNSGFPPSVKLANISGYDSQEYHLKLYKSQFCKECILKINPTIWTTSMILWFLPFLLNEYKKTVVATVRKVVRKIFDINKVESKIKRITRETISITNARRILNVNKILVHICAYPLTDDLAKSFDNVVEMDYAFENEIDEITPIKNPQEIGNQKSYGIARIKIINAKNLRQAYSWFSGDAYNPYVKILNFATSWIYVDTHVIYTTTAIQFGS
ncbi:2835_t:CDS:2, partial [Gigaspora rosea]